MQLIGRWWNRRWGRIGRRDIWLLRDGRRWRVQARHGDSDSAVLSWDFDREADARARVDLLRATGGDGWAETTSLYRRPDTTPPQTTPTPPTPPQTTPTQSASPYTTPTPPTPPQTAPRRPAGGPGSSGNG